jgi:hypothetical protein
MEIGHLKKTKNSVISTKIKKKIDELQYKVRTVDGGSCMGKIEEKKSFFVRKSLTEQSVDKKEPSTDPSEMTPYQKHMKFNRFKSTVMDKKEIAERKAM